MTPSIKGGWLPDSCEDFAVLQLAKAAPHLSCFMCREHFSPDNVQTPEGWRETQISGVCEVCFDRLMEEGEAGDSGVDTL